MGRAGTVAWWGILGSSLFAIGVGFLSGRSLGARAFAPPPPPAPGLAPPAVVRRELPRTLIGARSFESVADEDDRYGDPERAVAARPAGGAVPPFDRFRDRPRISVIVVDADRSASATIAFAQEPFPLAVVLAPDAEAETVRSIRAASKTVLTACDGATAREIAAATRNGASGIICSTADRARATALAAAARDGLVVDDLLDGTALTTAARSAHVSTASRDVVADARDDALTVDFLLGQTLAIARRTGVATVALHARPTSRLALERFAALADREGIELVALGGIATR